MTAVSVTDIAVNPNDSSQRYVLYGNGRVDNIGAAPAITARSDWTGVLYQPVAVALWITDWSTGAGYVLDLYGGAHPINGAPALSLSGLGVPYTQPTRTYVDWSWDPGGSGRLLVLDQYGKLWPANGANAATRSGPRWSWPAARRLKVQWSAGQPAKAITLDLYGGLHGDFGQTDAMAAGGYWPGWDAARDIAVVDWTGPKVQTLDLYGGVHPSGGATQAFGGPYKAGADVARRLVVLSAADPASYWQVWSGGQSFDWSASTAPTVTAGGDSNSPATTVTTTTRPTLAWSYSDPQKDSQAAWDLYVYTQTFVSGHDMTDPSAWASSALVHLSGVDRARRGAVADLDFANGSYRMYVRAQDTSGLWSAWSNLGWTQNVAAPATPTGLTAVADEASFTVALSVSCATGGSADTVRFDCSDDGGTTWGPVRGAETVPLAATTTATDRDIPLGVTRTYRAVAYNDSPGVASAPSASAMATINKIAYVLTSTDDPTLGGEIHLNDAPSWTRTAVAGVFDVVGGAFPVVVSDGVPKARKTTLQLLSDGTADWALIRALAESATTLLFRDGFGEATYCRVVGDWGRTQVAPAEYMHVTGVPLVEVAQPTVTDLASTVPPGPGS